jgi:hypothetical protein
VSEHLVFCWPNLKCLWYSRKFCRQRCSYARILQWSTAHHPDTCISTSFRPVRLSSVRTRGEYYESLKECREPLSKCAHLFWGFGTNRYIGSSKNWPYWALESGSSFSFFSFSVNCFNHNHFIIYTNWREHSYMLCLTNIYTSINHWKYTKGMFHLKILILFPSFISFYFIFFLFTSF